MASDWMELRKWGCLSIVLVVGFKTEQIETNLPISFIYFYCVLQQVRDANHSKLGVRGKLMVIHSQQAVQWTANPNAPRPIQSTAA